MMRRIREIAEEEFGFEPSYSSFNIIRHYYGDPTRALFLMGAALMLISSPLYVTSLPTQLPFIIAGAIVAVTFAGLTNPRTRWVLFGDAIIAGVGTVLYAFWALNSYQTIDSLAFALRISVALIFLFAFYFAIKSVRAEVLHQVGQKETFSEFSDEELERRGGENEEQRSRRKAQQEGKIEGWLMEEQ